MACVRVHGSILRFIIEEKPVNDTKYERKVKRLLKNNNQKTVDKKVTSYEHRIIGGDISFSVVKRGLPRKYEI